MRSELTLSMWLFISFFVWLTVFSFAVGIVFGSMISITGPKFLPGLFVKRGGCTQLHFSFSL